MGNESKIIRKTDDSAMALLYEILGDKVKNVLDIDSYYNINGTYHFLEFIKCDCKPFDFQPNQNWKYLNIQLSVIWDFSQRAEGILWLVCYTKEKDQFKILKVKNMNETNIEFIEELKLNFNEFKAWFQKMNSDVLKSK